MFNKIKKQMEKENQNNNEEFLKKVPEISEKINAIMKEYDCILLPSVSIVGGQIMSEIKIAKNNKKSNIVLPE